MNDLVMRMEDNNGDTTGVFNAARKLLNRASVERTISKQEAMCLVGQLPLVLCSETLTQSHYHLIPELEIARSNVEMMEREVIQAG
jgi:hypothetical protein